MIYLDHNATTPVAPEVFEAMRPWFTEHFGNPSSSHSSGRAAADAIALARERVAKAIGAQSSEIIFTGGGTEASNLAIRGVMAIRPGGLVISAIEHPATLHPAHFLETRGRELTILPVDESGRISEIRVPAGTALVSVMHANNETGVLQPIVELGEAAHAAGALIHTDAAQSVGKVVVHVDVLGVDLLTIAAHKMYGPKGVGALYLRRGVELEPLVRGAGHERGLRPGTENVPGIVGLGAACELAQRQLAGSMVKMAELRDQLWALLQPTGAWRTGMGEALPNTLHLRFPGVSGNAVLAACPGIAASTGSACHADGESPSSVLLAMGLNREDALGAIRLSLGRSTTEADVRSAATALLEAYGNLRQGRMS